MYENSELYDWLQDHYRNLSVACISIYDGAYQELLSFFPGKRMAELTESDAQRYVSHLCDSGLSLATVRKKVSSLSTIFRIFERRTFRESSVIRNPFQYLVPEVSEVTKPSNMVTSSEVDVVIRNAKKDDLLYLAVIMAVRMYLSRSSILDARHEDIVNRGERTYLMVWDKKRINRRGILIPSDVAAEFLRADKHIAERYPNSPYLLSCDAGRISERTLARKMATLREDSGVTGVTLWQLRNTGIATCSEPNKAIVAAACGANSNLHPDRYLEHPETYYDVTEKSYCRVKSF